MKVWLLTAKLIWHVLHWRGGDVVYLRLHGLSEAADDEMSRENWLLNDVYWTDDRGRTLLRQARDLLPVPAPACTTRMRGERDDRP